MLGFFSPEGGSVMPPNLPISADSLAVVTYLPCLVLPRVTYLLCAKSRRLSCIRWHLAKRSLLGIPELFLVQKPFSPCSKATARTWFSICLSRQLRKFRGFNAKGCSLNLLRVVTIEQKQQRNFTLYGNLYLKKTMLTCNTGVVFYELSGAIVAARIARKDLLNGFKISLSDILFCSIMCQEPCKEGFLQ